MNFIRLFLLMALLLFSAAAVDHSRQAIYAQRTAANANESLTREDSVFIQQLEKLASVQPASVVVQDGMLLGTGREQAAETHDPIGHAETEAIRDACRRYKTSVLKDGVLYASRQPCSMCTSIMIHTGITKVVIGSVSSGSSVRAFRINR